MSGTKTVFKTTVIQWIDYVVLTFLCVICFSYILNYGRDIAEMSVKFRFLDFPVFTGEFLLAGCGILYVWRSFLDPVRWTGWHLLLLLFFFFILYKALCGYCTWGPLALRDAAMFYYLAFAVIAYTCYRQNFFNLWVILISYTAILFLPFFSNEAWLMPRIYMGLVLAFKCNDRRWATLMTAGVLIFTPYNLFLETSRAIILGNFVSSCILITALVWMFNRKKYFWNWLGVFMFLLLFGGYVFYFSGSKVAHGIVAFDKVSAGFKETEDSINEKKGNFKPVVFEKVNIFNPNSEMKIAEQIDASTEGEKEITSSVVNPTPSPQQVQTDDKAMKIGTSIFRLLIWRDAKDELLKHKPVFGFNFGKPFRSESIEIVRWGINDWGRDGWIAMHNSYLNIIYRSGIIGIVFDVLIWSVLAHAILTFIRLKSVVGLLLCACLLVQLTAAFFSVTLELPYTAIPIWTLYGFVLAYMHRELGIKRTKSDL